MRIGSVSYEAPFMLAPLAGVSDSPFRQLAREQGAAMVYTEMVSADGLARGQRATLEYCRFDPAERPIGIQLFGSDPGVMAEATRALCDLRAEEDALRMLELTGCDAVMLGRAAFGDPWVFRRVRAFHERGETLPLPSAGERLAAGLRHLALMVRDAGRETAAREMRKHVAWYVKGLPRSAAMRDQVNKTQSVAEMEELLRGYLGELLASGEPGPVEDGAPPDSGAGREGLVAAG